MTERWLSAVAARDDEPATERRFKNAHASGAFPTPLRRAARLEPELALDDFERYFPYTPTALAIKECARLSVVRRYRCPGPVLDVGCGDGLFARIAFDDVEVWGIDIDAKEGRWAAASQAYAQVILADVTRATLPENFFATCVANCSLEHVPDIQRALKSIFHSLLPGGLAYMFVPNASWAGQLFSVRTLSRLGVRSLAIGIQRSIDRLFRHHHLYDEDGWRCVVAESGLEVIAIEPVLSTATTVAFEAFLLPSLAGLLNKHLTTRWTNLPAFRQVFAKPVYRVVRTMMDRADPSPTAEFLVVARRPET